MGPRASTGVWLGKEEEDVKIFDKSLGDKIQSEVNGVNQAATFIINTPVIS